MDASEKQHMEELADIYPAPSAVAVAIETLKEKLALARPTDLFVSDIHGEYRAFSHILRNGCGTIRATIDQIFGDELSEEQRAALATLIYYPTEKMKFELAHTEDAAAWTANALAQLAKVLRVYADRHTSADFGNVLRLCEHPADIAVLYNAENLPESAANVPTDEAPAVIEEMALTIQRLAVDHLYMLGDVYDRGEAPDLIMEELMAYHSVDVLWGNHDIVWMGAALGQVGCIAHVVRNCARYGNLGILEDAYGINIEPLKQFALTAYADDPCVGFALKGNPGLSPEETELNVKIQKAMAIIQFKVEAHLIDENPSFGLEDRKLMHLIDYEKGTVVVDGVEYEITDRVLPTVDRNDPYRLTDGEQTVLDSLVDAFTGCEKLQRHIAFFLEKGSLYRIVGNDLLFHACVPLNEDGSLKEVTLHGQTLKGKALFDAVDRYVRDAFEATDEASRKRGRDLLWYLWLGQGSPLFAKSKMATFEIYFIADKAARKEVKNPFYKLIEDEKVLAGIFEDFGMDPATSRIMCGHVPVKVKDGEDPVKCGGKALIIDGGFSKAYQPTTGIAGLTVIEDANGVTLATHEPLPPLEQIIEHNEDIHTTLRPIEKADKPIIMAETAQGAELKEQMMDIAKLAHCYGDGTVAPRTPDRIPQPRRS